MAELNTTGFALLGLLAQRPWSAYDLTQFMRLSYLRAIWPRAESRLYEGAKKLVYVGYATSSKVQQGKRSRTVYTITTAGQKALRDWLKTAGKDVLFEHEALLQLSHCDTGELEDLQAIIARLRASTDSDVTEMTAGLALLQDPTEQLSTDKKFVLNTLVNQFIYETLQARRRWVEFAEDFTRDWEDIEPSEEKMAASIDLYRKLAKQLGENPGAG